MSITLDSRDSPGSSCLLPTLDDEMMTSSLPLSHIQTSPSPQPLTQFQGGCSFKYSSRSRRAQVGTDLTATSVLLRYRPRPTTLRGKGQSARSPPEVWMRCPRASNPNGRDTFSATCLVCARSEAQLDTLTHKHALRDPSPVAPHPSAPLSSTGLNPCHTA